MLCGLTTALANANVLENFLKQVDWTEAGVKRAEFDAWWKKHRREDAERRIAEIQERQRVAALARAMVKLTDEEFEALHPSEDLRCARRQVRES
jgi:hypothetical protein